MTLKQRVYEALWEDANVLGLAGCAALSLSLLSPLPLLIAFVAEVVYLLYVPDSHWYANRVARWHDSLINDHQGAGRTSVTDSPGAARVRDLGRLRSVILARDGSESETLMGFLQKLDDLLEI